MAHALDFEEFSVDLLSQFPEVRKVLEALVDLEISRIVDGGFGPEGVLFFEVLLHMRVFVFDVEAGLHAIRDDAGAVAVAGWWRAARDPSRKQQPDAIRSAQVEILADDGFEEMPALDGAIEDLRQTDLELTDREAMVVACGAVGRGKRRRQPLRPPIEEGVNVGRAEHVTRSLQRVGISTRK